MRPATCGHMATWPTARQRRGATGRPAARRSARQRGRRPPTCRAVRERARSWCRRQPAPARGRPEPGRRRCCRCWHLRKNSHAKHSRKHRRPDGAAIRPEGEPTTPPRRLRLMLYAGCGGPTLSSAGVASRGGNHAPYGLLAGVRLSQTVELPGHPSYNPACGPVQLPRTERSRSGSNRHPSPLSGHGRGGLPVPRSAGCSPSRRAARARPVYDRHGAVTAASMWKPCRAVMASPCSRFP